MQSTADLAQLEQRVYRDYWQDGLLDLFAGLGITVIALAWISGHFVYGAIVPALLVPFWPVARQRLVEPRAGFVLLRPERQALLRMGLMTLVILGIFTFALGLAVFFLTQSGALSGGALSATLVPALPAALLASGALLAGFLFAIPRLLAYAGLLAAGALVGLATRAEPGWHFLAPGLLIALVGVILLIRFLRNHPRSPQLAPP